MASLSNALCFFAIVFIILHISNSKEESKWKSLRFISADGWSVKAEQFDNPVFAYALCEDSSAATAKRECMIVLHEDVHNEAAKPKQCTFTLENASNGIIRIENFGSDRAIFVWSDETEKKSTLHWKFQMAVIQMSTCKIIDSDLVVKANSIGWEYGDVGWHTFHIGILVYENTFDVVVQRARACGKAKDKNHCMYTYNSYGRKIGGPVTRFSPKDEEEFYQLKPSSHKSSEKSYVLMVDGKAPYVSMIKPKENSKNEAITKLLWKLPKNEGDNPVVAYSWNNELIAMCNCQVKDVKLSCLCLQMHEDGHSKRQMEFSIEKPSKASSMIVFLYNIRGGGYFLIPLYTHDKKNVYSMSKIDSYGRVSGRAITVGSHVLKCNPEPVNTRMIERDDGQYCMTMACVIDDKEGKVLKTLTKCYTPSALEWKFHAKDEL